MANRMAMAVSARSPPESSDSICSFFARRLRHDLDAAVQRVLGVGQPQFRAAAAEQLDEGALEILR